MRVLGIDPGLERVGWAVVEDHARSFQPLGWGLISTDFGLAPAVRLQAVYRRMRELIADRPCDLAVVERLFFTRNTSSAMAVAQARGVILLALADVSWPILEPNPMQIKQAVTGYGKADKMQMTAAVRRLLTMGDEPMVDDTADALAGALYGLTKRGA
ncbi:MAG: crossover junction endodeoxyribonuclease RuvC [Sulfobacillus sp.]